MNHVKGAFFVKTAKIVKADKSGVFDKFLTEDDQNLISTTLLPTGWYPWDTWKRCFNALAEVYAKGDMEICKEWGWADAEELSKSVYKSVIIEKNPKATFENVKLFWKLQFDFGELDLDFNSYNKMKVAIKDFDPDFEVFYWFTWGHWDKILELCGCKDVKSEILVKSWEGGGDTAYSFSWA